MRGLSGATADGTDAPELVQAIRGLGLTVTTHHSADAPAAWAFVRSNAMEGRPSLLCIDQWRHWVCVIGLIGGFVLLADSVGTKRNMVENGITPLSRPGLIRRWRCRNESEPFYALAVGR